MVEMQPLDHCRTDLPRWSGELQRVPHDEAGSYSDCLLASTDPSQKHGMGASRVRPAAAWPTLKRTRSLRSRRQGCGPCLLATFSVGEREMHWDECAFALVWTGWR